MSSPGSRSVWSSYGGLLFSLGASVVGIFLLIDAIPRIHPLFSGFPYDFAVDQATARGFLDHVNPFTESGARSLNLPQRFGNSGSGHPPTTSFWALPLARMTPEGANVVVDWMTVLLVLLEFLGIFGTLAWPAVLSLAWLAFAYVLSCTFMHYHLGVGQFSAAIGFFYFVSWRAGRRGQEALSGIALGLACTMKLFPGVMAILFLVQRRWRALIAMAATYLAIAVVMTSRYGIRSWLFFLSKQSAIANSWMSSPQNQSIHGVVLRMFYPVCGPGGGVLPIATAISTGISIGLLALAAWWVPRGRDAPRDATDVSFALLVVLSVITSQWSWEHYVIIYILPAAILTDKLVRAWWAGDRRLTNTIMLLLAAGVVAAWHVDMNTKTTLRAAVLAGHRQDHLRLHVYDLLNWTPGFLLGLLLFLVARRNHVEAKAGGLPGSLGLNEVVWGESTT